MKLARSHSVIRFLFVAPLMLAGYGPAGAQAAADSKPMTLTIRPSGQSEEPRTRQERLLKRLEQSDYWVRSICVQCGDAWKHQIYAPFNPLDALGRNGGGESSTE